ncbi:DUF4238 domain-containing protein [Corallococcus silvisoli]|uniref:DUF4238 domain-containing protein n=1 Tax=Corallococcus silvisoli TaxID=2697031 RepID=UPI00137764EC|nr:DUF4238 domain-containing protein [Corallococcus silvisoli]NBD12946.1 DUF4238 domain-containing protein [Corallococcus silvisoli]
MTEPRKHHVVPKFYLKRFSDKKERLTMVSRDQKIRTPPTIAEKACRELDFYAITSGGRRSQEVEGFLDKYIESPAANAIKSILKDKFPPPPQIRREISMFVAFQALRGHDFRRATQHLVDSMHEAIQSRLSQMQRPDAPSTPTLITNPESSIPIKLADKPSPQEIKLESILAMIKIAPGLANIISARKWFVFDHAEACLLTSDAPVVYWSAPTAERDYGYSLATSDYIALPLDTRHSLVMAYESQADEQVLSFGVSKGPELARGINALVAANASRWILHHPDIRPLDGLVLPPKEPPLHIG